MKVSPRGQYRYDRSSIIFHFFIISFFFITNTDSVFGFITPVSSSFHHRVSSAKDANNDKISIDDNIFLGGSINGKDDANDDNMKKKNSKKNIVVIGNGMVGQRFMEHLINIDKKNECLISTFCEEPRAAYNRVKLTSYFETRDPSSLSMTTEYDALGKTSWYDEQQVQILLNDKAVRIDTTQKTITGTSGTTIPYDVAVLATGSFPFVPPIPGKNRPGVFVYRTIQDLEDIWSYVQDNHVKSAAILGGGLLGLEAAKAVHDMGVDETHIIEFAPILMARQIDNGGHEAMISVIEGMGLKVHCNARTAAFIGVDGSDSESNDGSSSSPSPVAAVRFSNDGWEDLPVQMVVISAGIKPRDEIARDCGIQVGDRGGVVVDDQMRTSSADIFAIGEVALHKNFIYGLVAPGYDMAKVAAENVASDIGLLSSTPSKFTGADLSTKLKLLGCDVASFGENQPRPDDTDITELVWKDPFQAIYRKLIFNKAGTKLRGGILVGEASDFTTLQKLAVTKADISPQDCATLLPPPSVKKISSEGGETGEIPIDPNTLICSCNDVSRGMIAMAVQELGVDGANLKALKKCTKAGTGCGGCEPVVKTILAEEIKKLGGKVSNHLCEHFSYSRPELMALIRTDKDPSSVDSFEKIIKKHGHGDGCEVCKPAVASILASLFNGIILDGGRDALQDTNDRSLANMQRGGTYSVVPRVPGGEISPTQLIALGQTADKFGLYTKITGGQRIDLFGASKHQLPDIWEQLGEAGFESGHAYGKALRTVKSCVGSTWCRYGVQGK
jgi:nitrite reductase (NADH) large subunit